MHEMITNNLSKYTNVQSYEYTIQALVFNMYVSVEPFVTEIRQILVNLS